MKTILINLLKKLFRKVNELLPANNKLKHSYTGNSIYVISIISILIISLIFKWELSFAWNAVISLIITFAAACLREWYNSQEEDNKWSWKDIRYTILFPLIATILIIIKTI